jgi:hypothetical protein
VPRWIPPWHGENRWTLGMRKSYRVDYRVMCLTWGWFYGWYWLVWTWLGFWRPCVF